MLLAFEEVEAPPSVRELDVLKVIARGRGNKQMIRDLVIYLQENRP